MGIPFLKGKSSEGLRFLIPEYFCKKVLCVNLAASDALNQSGGRKMKTAKMTNVFAKKFRDKYGSIACTALIGHNISTPEGFEAAKKQDAFKHLCPNYVKSAAEILDEML